MGQLLYRGVLGPEYVFGDPESSPEFHATGIELLDGESVVEIIGLSNDFLLVGLWAGTQLRLCQLEESGSRNFDFGEDGYVSVSIGLSDPEGVQLFRLPGNRALAANYMGSSLHLHCFDNSGNPDLTFGDSGLAEFELEGMALSEHPLLQTDDNGQLYLFEPGATGPQLRLVCDAQGQGAEGMIPISPISVPEEANLEVQWRQLLRLGSGQWMLAGLCPVPPEAEEGLSGEKLLIYRFDADGQPISEYGREGLAFHRIPTAAELVRIFQSIEDEGTLLIHLRQSLNTEIKGELLIQVQLESSPEDNEEQIPIAMSSTEGVVWSALSSGVGSGQIFIPGVVPPVLKVPWMRIEMDRLHYGGADIGHEWQFYWGISLDWGRDNPLNFKAKKDFYMKTVKRDPFVPGDVILNQTLINAPLPYTLNKDYRMGVGGSAQELDWIHNDIAWLRFVWLMSPDGTVLHKNDLLKIDSWPWGTAEISYTYRGWVEWRNL